MVPDDAPQPLAPGTVVAGRYRVERLLGRGGMALVYEATQLALGTRVALKVLIPGRRNPGVVARFEQEARVAASLTSPHATRVIDFGWSGDTPFLAMELLVGRDLAQELEARAPLPVAEAVDHVLEACVGIADAHRRGLVHRDLKPSNLFLADLGTGARAIKVLDFGLSKVVQADVAPSLTASADAFGTPQYMAPEQIESAKNVDARCDQHALAMILFEALTGRPPYAADSAAKIIVLIATKPPPSARELAPAVPSGLDAALRRALAKQPDARFADLAGFAEALAPFGGARGRELAASVRAVLANVGPAAGAAPAQPVGPASMEAITLSPRRGGRARAVGLAAAALALVAAVAGWALWSRPTNPRTAASAASAAAAPEPAPPASSQPAPSAPAAPASSPSSAPAALATAPSAPASHAPSATSSARGPRRPAGPAKAGGPKRPCGLDCYD